MVDVKNEEGGGEDGGSEDENQIQDFKAVNIQNNYRLSPYILNPDEGYSAMKQARIYVDVKPNNYNLSSITKNGSYYIPSGYSGFNNFYVDVPQEKVQNSKSVTITKNYKVTPYNLIPDSGYDCLRQANIFVDVPTLIPYSISEIKQNGIVYIPEGYGATGQFLVNVPKIRILGFKMDEGEMLFKDFHAGIGQTVRMQPRKIFIHIKKDENNVTLFRIRYVRDYIDMNVKMTGYEDKYEDTADEIIYPNEFYYFSDFDYYKSDWSLQWPFTIQAIDQNRNNFAKIKMSMLRVFHNYGNVYYDYYVNNTDPEMRDVNYPEFVRGAFQSITESPDIDFSIW